MLKKFYIFLSYFRRKYCMFHAVEGPVAAMAAMSPSSRLSPSAPPFIPPFQASMVIDIEADDSNDDTDQDCNDAGISFPSVSPPILSNWMFPGAATTVDNVSHQPVVFPSGFVRNYGLDPASFVSASHLFRVGIAFTTVPEQSLKPTLLRPQP